VAFDFIHGDDEYLTEQLAREKWASVSAGTDAEFGREIVDGRCARVEEVGEMARRLREATQTMGLFGGARAVWLKGVNFISDTVVGRAEGTLEILEELKPLLENAKPEEVKILISATPVDKRLSFFKWLAGKGKCLAAPSLEGLDAEGLIQMGKEKGLAFEHDAAELFLRKVGTSARGLENEMEKLATYLDAGSVNRSPSVRSLSHTQNSVPDSLTQGLRPVSEETKENIVNTSEAGAGAAAPKTVTQDLVIELTSTIAEGEFFEPLEAFYSRKPTWALQSVREYFSKKDNDVRPILAAFFGRNRLLMLIKGALAEGLCKAGFKGLSWTSKGEALRSKMGAEKTPFNLFAQNPWYLGKLSQEAARFTLEELQTMQKELMGVFEEMHVKDQATVFEGFVVRHLPAGK
jgi:DNA polymerase-3 subunit delta